MIRFSDTGHVYESIEPDNRKWISVSTLITMLKQPFDEMRISEACSKKLDSKWYGLSAEDIRAIWKGERDRSTELGTWYHYTKEIGEDPVNMCIVKDGWKYARPQQLEPGVYPEFILHLGDYNLCGQADRIVVDGSSFSIRDYKTNKAIVSESYRGKRMFFPMERYEDVNINHYALQLSLYAYMVKQHNPNLKLTELVIEHVRFKVRRVNKYGYPEIYKTWKGEYVIEDVTPIKVPYLEYEVKNVLKNLPRIVENYTYSKAKSF